MPNRDKGKELERVCVASQRKIDLRQRRIGLSIKDFTPQRTNAPLQEDWGDFISSCFILKIHASDFRTADLTQDGSNKMHSRKVQTLISPKVAGRTQIPKTQMNSMFLHLQTTQEISS